MKTLEKFLNYVGGIVLSILLIIIIILGASIIVPCALIYISYIIMKKAFGFSNSHTDCDKSTLEIQLFAKDRKRPFKTFKTKL